MFNLKITNEDFFLEEKSSSALKIINKTCGLIVNENNNICCIVEDGYFKLISAEIQKNETPEQCFENEILKKFGYKSKNLKLIGEADENLSSFETNLHCFIFKGFPSDESNLLDLAQKCVDNKTIIWETPENLIENFQNQLKSLNAINNKSTYTKQFETLRNLTIIKNYNLLEKN